MERQIALAYQQADPATAWALTKKLLDQSRKFLVEAAKARFRINFGTRLCRQCEGLRAGKEVVATCYQRELCYFDNFKEDQTSYRQRGVIENLIENPKKRMETI